MLMALKPEHLAKAIEGMKALAKNGLRYPIAPYGIQADVRADPLLFLVGDVQGVELLLLLLDGAREEIVDGRDLGDELPFGIGFVVGEDLRLHPIVPPRRLVGVVGLRGRAGGTAEDRDGGRRADER